MTVTPTAIPDVLLIEPRVFRDDRGSFFESFNQQDFSAKVKSDATFVQDNQSASLKSVIRGLHYQIRQPQGKLVRVLAGVIFDVAVDLRRSSPTFGRWVGALIDADSRQQIWIPPGFAHGFSVQSDSAEVVYKATDYYAPQHERTIVWNDPALGIDWRVTGEPRLSLKDREGVAFQSAEVFD